MWFEGREVGEYTERVPIAELRVGEVYFQVSYTDDTFTVPEMEALVYLGRDLEQPGLYFQDAHSYGAGVRIGQSNTTGEEAFIEIKSIQSDSSYVYEFERALDVLLRCSLRRAGRVQ